MTVARPRGDQGGVARRDGGCGRGVPLGRHAVGLVGPRRAAQRQQRRQSYQYRSNRPFHVFNTLGATHFLEWFALLQWCVGEVQRASVSASHLDYTQVSGL